MSEKKLVFENGAEIEFSSFEFEATEFLSGCDEIAPFTEDMYAHLRKMLTIALSFELKCTPKGRSWLYEWWWQQIRNDEEKRAGE